MAPTEPRAIDWDSATVEDGALTVALTGQSSKDWRARFASILTLLGTPHGAWGEVTLAKNRIEVADVRQGSESDLRHFLESVVVQANADTRADGETSGDEPTEEDGVDAQMTRAFRAFAAGSG